jgi:hypothetical protein
MATTDTQATIEELLEAVFSVLSVPRLYNEGQLSLRKSPETAVIRVGSWCEIVTSLRGREPGAEDRPLLEDVTKQSKDRDREH